LRSAKREYKKALKLIEESLSLRRDIGDTEKTFRTHNMLVLTLIGMERIDAATAEARGALKLALVRGEQHPRVAQARITLGDCLFASGDRAGAFAEARRALATREARVRHLLFRIAPEERYGLVRSLYSALTRVVAWQQPGETNAYEAVLRNKGLAGRANALERATQRAIRTDRDRAELAKLTRLRRLLSAAWRISDNARTRQLELEHDALARELASRLKLPKTDPVWLAPELPAIRKALGPNDALIDFLQAGNRFFAWVVTADQALIRIDLGTAHKLEFATREFSRSLRRRKGVPAAGRAAAALVWKPMAKALEGKTTIYIIPDGATATIPFAALPGADDEPLIVGRRVLYLTSAADLLARASNATGTGLVAVGGLDYGPVPRYFDRPYQGKPLAYSLDEARMVHALFGKHRKEKARLIQKDEATQAALANVRRVRILHLATHGYVDLRAPLKDDGLGSVDPLLLAGLSLSGANRKGGAVLTAFDASLLDLEGSQLVVLSACKTAGGSRQAGEGTIGLVRGFREAGARHVVASLWSIDDAATVEFMRLFYGQLLIRNQAPPEALRQAALEMRRNSGRSDVWAAFVAYGFK